MLTKQSVRRLSIISNVTRKKNCHMQVIDTFLSTSIDKVSAIYLFEVGRVDDVKSLYKLDESLYDRNSLLMKYGMTKDLRRRTKEHEKKYGKELKLRYHVNIDVAYLSYAEKDVRSFFKKEGLHLKHQKFNELVVVPLEMIDNQVYLYLKELASKYNLKTMMSLKM